MKTSKVKLVAALLATIRALLTVSAVTMIAGCGGESSDSGDAEPPPGQSNLPPVISGQPAASVTVGEPYSFQPATSDPNGDTLQFTATNIPSWAGFNSANGRLTGTPSAANVGTYSGITITVTDGTASASLAPFSIDVTQVATGSATVSWTPPLSNEDGSQLVNLAGYRILYGRSANDLTQTVSLTNPSLSTYVLENLSPGTWFFAIVTVNTQDTESQPSNPASTTI